MATTVHAQWTSDNARNVAQPQMMIVSGVIAGSALEKIEQAYQIPSPQQEAPESDQSQIATGTCFCGKIALELPVHLKPAISVICHCTDCRQWHSVGSIPYMMFPLRDVDSHRGKLPIKVINGEKLLAWVHRTPEVRRYYAKCCGTRLFNSVWNEKMGLKLCGTFPTVFPSYEWKPTMHVNVRESNYPLLDVVKWNDLPAEFGGTGTHPENQ